MKKSLPLVVAFATLTFINSCRDELIAKNEEQSVMISDATTKNGRLYFPNKESLTLAYEKLKNEDDEVIANYIDSKNIISLRPILTKKNEEKIGQQLRKRIEILKLNKRYLTSKGAINTVANSDAIAEDLDDLEEIIGDDAFGAFLDSRAEIQVSDQI